MERLTRHVRIVSTLGPASRAPEVIEGLLRAGVDVTRLNLNYGAAEEHAQTVTDVRRLSRKLGLPTGILMDMPGLKKRRGSMREVFGDHLEFARAQGVDFVALSFISQAQQVTEVRALLKEMRYDVPLIVKIEQAPALAESEAILDLADGIMVARGDLALQISIEKVPLAQKRLIRAANQRGKPVITATQMLESMTRSVSPTRAEATDVANAVLDGTDALMLSEESAIGKHPALVVEMMVKIAREAETAFPYEERLRGSGGYTPEINDATARAACLIAQQIGARAIVIFTSGGTTAMRVSRYRPAQPIVAVTPSETVLHRLSLLWGVYPVMRPDHASGLEHAFDMAASVAEQIGAVRKGDRIVLTAGLPLMVSGNTNLVKVHQV